jgi:hypothetical protein
MPVPKQNETQDDFVSRCIPIVLEDGTAEDQKQAAAVCFSMWREEKQEEVAVMSFSDIRQIARSAIETALAIINDSGEITQGRAVKLLHALEHDLSEARENPVAEVATFDIDGQRVTMEDLIAVYREAKWTTAFVNDLPDNSFAIIMPGGEKDDEGKTAPRNLRKLPYKDAQGNVDIPHLRNALARISQVEGVSESAIAKARAKLEAAAEKHLKTRQEECNSEFTESAALPETVTDYDGDLSILTESEQAKVETGRRAPVVVDMQLIVPGPGNKKDNHYYPAEVLERDIHVFEGAHVFATDHDARQRNENTKVGKVLGVPTRFTEQRAPVGQILIYDPDQAEKTRNRADAGELGTMECSIFGKGMAQKGEVGGQEYKVVESLTEGIYLELVSNAGAGGRALNLAESYTGGGNVDDKEKAAVEEAEEKLTETTFKEQAEQEQEEEIQEQEPTFLSEADVSEALTKTNLPQPSQRRLAEGRYQDEDALKKAIATEIAYVKELTGSGKPVQVKSKPFESTATLEEVQKKKDAVNQKWLRTTVREVKRND